MELVFISGPYRAKTIYEIKKNIDNAEKIGLKYFKIGYAVFIPHKNSAFFDGSCDDSVWLNSCIEILKRCDKIVMMSNWQKSSGAISEYNYARKNNIEVIFDEEEF